MPAKGQPMIDFALPNQDGETVKLSDFRGKKVVLFAYPRANTPGCTTQACGFNERLANIIAKNATVLGISHDEPKDLKAWKDQEGLKFDLLSDPEHKVLEQLGVWQEKTNFGKTYMGTVRSHWVIGEDGTVIDEQIKISPEDSVKKAYELL